LTRRWPRRACESLSYGRPFPRAPASREDSAARNSDTPEGLAVEIPRSFGTIQTVVVRFLSFFLPEAHVTTRLTPAVVLVAVFAVGGVAYAHHGSASYNTEPTTMKDVTVTQVNWGNPHTLLFFDHTDA